MTGSTAARPRTKFEDEPIAGDRSPDVVVVILNWNRWDATRACIESVAASDYPRRRIVVVDNGSDDPPSAADVLALGADHFIQTGANLGYAGGNNEGIRIALDQRADFVWVLNNDTIVEPGAMSELVAAAALDPKIGVLTTNVHALDGRVETDVAFGGTSRDAPMDFFGTARVLGCDGSCRVGLHAARAVRGPSLFFRLTALRAAGPFDEAYFHYYEEVDLVERLWRTDWRAGLACRSVVSHASGTTLPSMTGQAIYYLLRNYLRFRRKLFGESVFEVFARHPVKLPRHVAAARHTLHGEMRPVRAHILALADAVRGRSGRRSLGDLFQEPFAFEE